MSLVEKGKIVSVEYTGKLGSGEVFDSNVGAEPLEFEASAGQMIPGFDAAILGMAIGDSKTFVIPAAEAYGDHSEEMVVSFPKAEVDPEGEIEIGQQLSLNDDEGNEYPAMVIDVTDEFIILDANHPLAGEDLTFEVKILNVEA